MNIPRTYKNDSNHFAFKPIKVPILDTQNPRSYFIYIRSIVLKLNDTNLLASHFASVYRNMS